MKTQISRVSFNQERRYSGVYQQQGRMFTDADWNNLVELLKGDLAAALQDVVGNGTPRSGALSITSDRRIQPGDVYVDGLRGQFPGTVPVVASNQGDLPGFPDLPASGPYVVYADIWERSVTCLEDTELRDAALHGADTCSRNQLMVQVKTCGQSVDPNTDIPQQGNAHLSLGLHTSLEAGDPCDPCAGLVSAGAGRVGNYLFRLEVHAITGPATNPTGLVLKWSSENGAEQYAAKAAAQMPPGFVNSNYLYEFFDVVSEKHLGVQLSQGFTPRQGALKIGYEIPVSVNEPKDFVRRWDGYCKLARSGSTWSLVVGWDKGNILDTASSATAPGHVTLGSSLTINLEALRLALELSGRTFVPGDYWLATVREALHSPGSPVLDAALPSGIVHHYLFLARVAASGSVDPPADDAQRRQYSFPPLTDLQAYDVGYKADCSKGLYKDFEGNVKQALDLICSIQADHIGFVKPCNTSIYNGQSVTNVAEALELLCNIKASHVSYQAGTGCSYLNQPDIKTVQAALDALCKRPSGGGCRVTVGKGAQYETLEQAIKALLEQGILDIAICLLPGDHEYAGTLSKSDKMDHLTVAISGCGAGSRLVLTDAVQLSDIDALSLENMAVSKGGKENPLRIVDCREVVVNAVDCIGLAVETPLVDISGGDRISLTDCRLEAYSSNKGLANPQSVFASLEELAAIYQTLGRDAFQVKAQTAAGALSKMSPANRQRFIEQMTAAMDELGQRLSIEERISYQLLASLLAGKKVTVAQLFDTLLEIRDQAHHAAAGLALVVQDARAELDLQGNNIFGVVSLYGATGGKDLNAEEINALQNLFKEGTNVTFQAEPSFCRANGNSLSRLAVAAEAVAMIRTVLTNGSGVFRCLYRTIHLEGNFIAREGNQILGKDITLTGNDLLSLQNPVAWVIGETIIFSANRVRREAQIQAASMAHVNLALTSVGGGTVLSAGRDIAKAANLPSGSW